MRAKYPQADGRGIVPRKWSALKTGGPLIHFAELVLKRLIQHGWPADYKSLWNEGESRLVRFDNELGVTPEFEEALLRACQIVARRCRCLFSLAGTVLELSGWWWLKLRYANGKIVAVTFYRALPEQLEPYCLFWLLWLGAVPWDKREAPF